MYIDKKLDVLHQTLVNVEQNVRNLGYLINIDLNE